MRERERENLTSNAGVKKIESVLPLKRGKTRTIETCQFGGQHDVSRYHDRTCARRSSLKRRWRINPTRLSFHFPSKHKSKLNRCAIVRPDVTSVINSRLVKRFASLVLLYWFIFCCAIELYFGNVKRAFTCHFFLEFNSTKKNVMLKKKDTRQCSARKVVYIASNVRIRDKLLSTVYYCLLRFITVYYDCRVLEILHSFYAT